MARDHPQSEDGCHSISLNAGKDVDGETPRHQESDVRTVTDSSQGDEFELSDSAPDVADDISSCLEYDKVDKANHLVVPDGSPSLRRSVSLQRRQQRQMATARRKASVMSLSDTSDQLYTLVDGVTGHVDGEVGLAALPSLTALLNARRNVFKRVQSGFESRRLIRYGGHRPDNELNSSSLLDEKVLESTKAALSARIGSSLLKNPSDPYYPLGKEFQDAVCHHDSPSVLPPDRGIRHEIDLTPGTNYCVTRQ